MGLQMPLCDKLFSTALKATRKGSLSSMNANVSFEVAGLLELAQALHEWAEQSSSRATRFLGVREAVVNLDALLEEEEPHATTR